MDAFLNEWYGILAFVLFDVIALFAVVCITYRWLFKRIFDFLCALVCLIFTAPLFLFVYLRARAAKTRGEIPQIFEKREFIGKKGKKITLKTFAVCGENGEETRHGKWLKKTGFYALPKLLDVLAGKLSVVGVKPFTELDLAFLDEEEEDRFIVKAGLINPLVRSGNKATDYDEMIKSDLKYAWNFSFFTDVKIFFSWLLKKIRGEGKEYLGETRNCSYAESLLNEGRISKEEYFAVLEEINLSVSNE